MSPSTRPTDRPTGRRDEPRSSDLTRGAERREHATDSHASVRPLLTATRRPRQGSLRHVAEQLSDRDQHVLVAVGQMHLLTARQVERMHFQEGSHLTRARRCRNTLARLFDLDLLARLERRVGGVHAGSAGYIYRLSPRGRRLLDRPGPSGGRRRRLPEPSIRFQDHTLAISELCVRLYEANAAEEVELVRFEAEPTCWRTFSGLAGERLTIRPDAFVVVAHGEYEQLSFVEVDLGTEGMAAIRRKAAAYRAYARSGQEQAAGGVFPTVSFLASNERRAGVLRRTLHALPDGKELFTVGTTTDAVSLLKGGES